MATAAIKSNNILALLFCQCGDRYMAIARDTNPAIKEKSPYIIDQFNSSNNEPQRKLKLFVLYQIQANSPA
jgi:hypothetical protein